MGQIISFAKAAIEAALSAGKNVVTANKALLAVHGQALAELAEARLYRPAIDSTFAFPAFVDAHARIDQGHKAGSVVVMA